MQMEYSAEDIAAARSLQCLVYLCTSMAVFWTYDYACSLHEEWTFLFRSRWTKLYSAFGSSTHLPDGELTYRASEYFNPNENSDKCQMLIVIYSYFSMISVGCSELFFVLRTYALWNNNRIILVAMLSTFLAVAIASTVICFITVGTSQVTTSAIPGIPGCYRTSTSFNLNAIQFLLLFAFQLGLVCLTLLRVIQSWQTTNGPLYAILVKHNIFWYASGLFLSAMNILISIMFTHSAYHSLIEDFEFVVLTILATRMHLHVWQMDQDAHGSDALGMIYLFDMLPADLMA
ncbi:hypothetical protein DEU56DRAFT_65296 [Suillus clintonianus]|uniref:uncharacterized protein n=1 Tax=Suillus clintonianus TaxID=1904413 RepID=UPI001B8736F1|nr:uncharacterized protein DEU56DRAFT_65296 [Suillus clintonianus]KAG2123078.1 hypothetical protein DEU56DRAFT_65296 [Suillus clintonianus]